MSPKLANACPMIAAISAIGYCVWPFLDAGEQPEPKRNKPPALEAPLLGPKMLEPSERNPFLAASKVDLLPPDRTALADSGDTAPSERAPGSIKSGWVLGATLIHGNRRAAVIDGRVYLLGERLKVSGHPEQVVQLTRVERDAVRLSVAGSTHEIVLTHPERGKSAAAPVRAVAAARPAGQPEARQREDSAPATPISRVTSPIPGVLGVFER
jgi:hypothetical protein